MTEWRIICDQAQKGPVNMATDLALLQSCNEGLSGPTLRLYGWSGISVTLGYAQSEKDQIEEELCRSLNIPISRRPTGGRAMVHQNELTYSLAAPIPHEQFPSSLKGAYTAVSRAVENSLRRLGVENILCRAVPPKASGIERDKFRSPACFANLNGHEISFDGKKLTGGAQRRLKNAFLQQGSVLLDCDREFANTLFKFPDDEAREKNLKILQDQTISMNEILNKSLSLEESILAFKKGFMETFPGDWNAQGLSDWEGNFRDSHMAPI